MNAPIHPCTHCASRPNEQAQLMTWADQVFGGRLPVAALAARLNRETATATEFAVSGDADLVIDQTAMMVVLAYRLCGALDADLWEQVTAKIAELQSSPDALEMF